MDSQQSYRDLVFRERVYLICSALFISSIVTGNLIFLKFFEWSLLPFGIDYTFILSVGILPFPVTFLITDILSEIYGIRRANQVVIAGFIANLFMMLIVLIGQAAPVFSNSPVSDEIFDQVFNLAPAAVFASICAYLIAQLVDIRIYHFWKRMTKGKHLWLRNNASTVCSSFIDTFTVIFLLCLFKALQWEQFWSLVMNGFLFKTLIAMFDTPIIYVCVLYLRKRMNLKPGEELPDQQVLV